MADTLYAYLDAALGLSSQSQELAYYQMTARAVMMYIALLVIVRAGKKRFLGRATAFDVLLVITLGSIAARAITGGAPFFVSIVALAALVFLHWLFSAIARDWQYFSGLIKGHSTILVQSGQVDHEALRGVHMSTDDLAEDLRQQGVADPGRVKEARLERSGQLSVIQK